MTAARREIPLLVRFFDPDEHARDGRGRRLLDILSWDDYKLEMSHDYIQMLFPLPEGSIFNPFAPVVTKEVRDAFLQRKDLRDSQLRAFDKILSFYGLVAVNKKASDGAAPTVTVSHGAMWCTNSGNWLTQFNHNHLRISRIIRSLRVLGSEEQAVALSEFLASFDEVKKRVGKRSLMYWERAAKRPLHLPPDEDDESAVGIAWLRDT